MNFLFISGQLLIFKQIGLMFCSPVDNYTFQDKPATSFPILTDSDISWNVFKESDTENYHPIQTPPTNPQIHQVSENHSIVNNCTRNGGRCLDSSNKTCHSPLASADDYCYNEPQSIGCCLDSYDEDPCRYLGGRCFNSYNLSDICQFKVIDSLCTTQPEHIKCCMGADNAKTCVEEGGTCMLFNTTEKFCWIGSKLGYFVDSACDDNSSIKCCLSFTKNTDAT